MRFHDYFKNIKNAIKIDDEKNMLQLIDHYPHLLLDKDLIKLCYKRSAYKCLEIFMSVGIDFLEDYIVHDAIKNNNVRFLEILFKFIFHDNQKTNDILDIMSLNHEIDIHNKYIIPNKFIDNPLVSPKFIFDKTEDTTTFAKKLSVLKCSSFSEYLELNRLFDSSIKRNPSVIISSASFYLEFYRNNNIYSGLHGLNISNAASMAQKMSQYLLEQNNFEYFNHIDEIVIINIMHDNIHDKEFIEKILLVRKEFKNKFTYINNFMNNNSITVFEALYNYGFVNKVIANDLLKVYSLIQNFYGPYYYVDKLFFAFFKLYGNNKKFVELIERMTNFDFFKIDLWNKYSGLYEFKKKNNHLFESGHEMYSYFHDLFINNIYDFELADIFTDTYSTKNYCKFSLENLQSDHNYPYYHPDNDHNDYNDNDNISNYSDDSTTYASYYHIATVHEKKDPILLELEKNLGYQKHSLFIKSDSIVRNFLASHNYHGLIKTIFEECPYNLVMNATKIYSDDPHVENVFNIYKEYVNDTDTKKRLKSLITEFNNFVKILKDITGSNSMFDVFLNIKTVYGSVYRKNMENIFDSNLLN